MFMKEPMYEALVLSNIQNVNVGLGYEMRNIVGSHLLDKCVVSPISKEIELQAAANVCNPAGTLANQVSGCQSAALVIVRRDCWDGFGNLAINGHNRHIEVLVLIDFQR